MKLLLDTHAFIWWDSDPIKLGADVLEMCQDPGNLLMLSAEVSGRCRSNSSLAN